jgi:hypothetical protein
MVVDIVDCRLLGIDWASTGVDWASTGGRLRIDRVSTGTDQDRPNTA